MGLLLLGDISILLACWTHSGVINVLGLALLSAPYSANARSCWPLASTQRVPHLAHFLVLAPGSPSRSLGIMAPTQRVTESVTLALLSDDRFSWPPRDYSASDRSCRLQVTLLSVFSIMLASCPFLPYSACSSVSWPHAPSCPTRLVPQYPGLMPLHALLSVFSDMLASWPTQRVLHHAGLLALHAILHESSVFPTVWRSWASWLLLTGQQGSWPYSPSRRASHVAWRPQ
jgi:hypothetical protein